MAGKHAGNLNVPLKCGDNNLNVATQILGLNVATIISKCAATILRDWFLCRAQLFDPIIPLHLLHTRVCCHKAIFSKTLAWVVFCCSFMYRNSTKKLKNLGRRFHEWKLVWSFGLIYSVKRVKNSVKNAISKIGLKPTHKCQTYKTNVLLTILGGSWLFFAVWKRALLPIFCAISEHKKAAKKHPS